MFKNIFELEKEVFRNFFGINKKDVRKKIILSPYAPPKSFNELLKEGNEFRGFLFSGLNTEQFTYLKTGIGASLVGDCILSLKNTSAEVILFLGSCGGLNQTKIGDIIIPTRAYNGEGFSAYYTKPSFNLTKENFITPDASYINKTSELLKKYGIEFKKGDIFSTGSLFSENNPFLKNLEKNNFLGIDMELSAFFSALDVIGIKGAALLYVSDLPLINPFFKPKEKTKSMRFSLDSILKPALKIIEEL